MTFHLSWSTLDVVVLTWKVSCSFFVDFNLVLRTQTPYVKLHYSGNCRWSVKEAMILLFVEHSVQLYLFQNTKFPKSFMLSLYSLYLSKYHVQNTFIPEIMGALRKKQHYCVFRGAPCTYHFQSVNSPESCLLTLTWRSFPNCKEAAILLLSWTTLYIAFQKKKKKKRNLNLVLLILI